MLSSNIAFCKRGCFTFCFKRPKTHWKYFLFFSFQISIWQPLVKGHDNNHSKWFSGLIGLWSRWFWLFCMLKHKVLMKPNRFYQSSICFRLAEIVDFEIVAHPRPSYYMGFNLYTQYWSAECVVWHGEGWLGCLSTQVVVQGAGFWPCASPVPALVIVEWPESNMFYAQPGSRYSARP